MPEERSTEELMEMARQIHEDTLRRAMGGQGESSGPSFSTWVGNFRYRNSETGEERPLTATGATIAAQDSINQIEEIMREQQRLMVWSPSREPRTATEAPVGFYDDLDGVRRPYWASYGSQIRMEPPPRWVGRAEGYASPITYETLRRGYESLVGYGQANLDNTGLDGQPITRTQRGEQMRFSGRPDPLSEQDLRKLDEFYTKVLKDGFAQWPLPTNKVQIWLDGVARSICVDLQWGIESLHLYIGYSRDEGSGEFASPVVRLACITALMGITGHSGKPLLIAALSERLAKVMAGVYESVVKPLAVTGDAKPIRRMAWSASGGLASWLDGGWVGLTGEPVAVGEGWTVIDTEEGPVEVGAPGVTEPQRVTEAVPGRMFAEMLRENGWTTMRMGDGRSFVHFDRQHSLRAAQTHYERVQEEGYPVEWVEEGEYVGFAEARPVPVVVSRTAREELDRAMERLGTLVMPDGRRRMNLGYPTWERAEESRRIHFSEAPQLITEQLENGDWVITYPLETVSASAMMTHAEWVEVKGRFDRWARIWSIVPTPDGRPSVSWGGQNEESREEHQRSVGQYDLVGCIVERDSSNNWAITYPPEHPADAPVRGYDELLEDREWITNSSEGTVYIPIIADEYHRALAEGYTGIRFDSEIGGIGGIVRA